MSAASSGSSSPSSASCARIMPVDLGLDRVGAGERRFLRHQRGRRAEREAGDVPQRLKRGRAHPPLGHQRVEALEVPLLLRRHARDQLGFGAIARAARRAARHRCASRHIRRPGRRAASRRVSARRSPGRQPLIARAALKRQEQDQRRAAERQDRVPAGHRNAEEAELHLVAADQRRVGDLLQQLGGAAAPGQSRCRCVKPSKILASTPA